MPTITIQTKSNESFSVEYEVETPPRMNLPVVDIKRISIKDYELEFYSFKILHNELFEEIVGKCKEHFSKVEDADDLKTVNIG